MTIGEIYDKMIKPLSAADQMRLATLISINMDPRLNFREGDIDQLDGTQSVCYLLGAGFSAATCYKLPIAVGFLSRTWKWTCPGEPDIKETEAPNPDLLKHIEEQYGELDNLNLESVMTDLYVRGFGVGQAYQRQSPYPNAVSAAELRRDYVDLLDYIVKRVKVVSPTCANEPCALTNRFVKVLKAQDSVVTLNYDTIIEKHLYESESFENQSRVSRLQNRLGPPATGNNGTSPQTFLSFDAPRKGVFVKLHGSTDWIACPNKHCPNYLYIYAMSVWHFSRSDAK